MKVLVVVVMVLSEVMNESPLLFDPMTHPAPPRTTTAIGTGNSRVVGSRSSSTVTRPRPWRVNLTDHGDELHVEPQASWSFCGRQHNLICASPGHALAS